MKSCKVNVGMAWLNFGIRQNHVSFQDWEKYAFEVELNSTVFKAQNWTYEYSCGLSKGVILNWLGHWMELMLQIWALADEITRGRSCSGLNSKVKTIFKVCREMCASSCTALAGDHSCMAVILREGCCSGVGSGCFGYCAGSFCWVWHCNSHPPESAVACAMVPFPCHMTGC